MNMTFAQKILAKTSGHKSTSVGDIVDSYVDVAMMDDILGPRIEIADGLKELNAGVWDRNKTVIICDHYTPPCDIQQAEIVSFTKKWATENGIDNYYEYEGPCHQVMAEKGFDRPGTLVVGTDSHTCTSGAFGAFGTGIGSTEMIGVLVLGRIWLRVPESIKVVWEGRLNDGVYAKDMVLSDCKQIGHSGATYRVIEYSGDAVSSLSMDERMAITNMAVEMGAKTGYIPPDEKTFAYLEEIGVQRKAYDPVYPDTDASYCLKLNKDAGSLAPQVACPDHVDNVCDVGDTAGEKLTQVYIGSCTGGRLDDLRIASRVLKGKKAKQGIRLLVSPASKKIYSQALKEGLIEILADAGAVIAAPSCGLCLGAHTGILAAGEKCISTTNRNFIGRMGSRESKVYLASAATAAASAIEGAIADPRKYI
jgi:3-isopropylmalate/(R)-2-methylmalate dehydratase large subunit